MPVNETRCYGTKVSIDKSDVKSFWSERAKHAKGLNSVLLGNQKDDSESYLRNEHEFKLLESVLGKLENISVLDIGCGMGRWAKNLKDRNCDYTGLDYSSEFIELDKKLYPSMKFYTMDAENIDITMLEKTYDLVIINGVLMYINDSALEKIYSTLKELSPKNIYLQESISVIEQRLTLNKFYSEELNKNYSAIYRRAAEYENLLKKYLPNYKILKSGLMLNEKTGARKETNAKFWILKRSE